MSEPETAPESAPIRFIDYRGHNGFALGQPLEIATVEDAWQRGYYEREVEKLERSDALSLKYGFSWGTDRSTCGQCGADFTLARDGDRAVASTECVHPGGLKPYRVLLDVPSGEIVFANDLRSLVICDEPPGPSVNYAIGRKATTEAFARTGMVHISVGNSCPNVMAEPDGSYVVARGHIDEEDENGEPLPDDVILAAEKALEERCLASICTDLWWFSAMDSDWFYARCTDEGVDPNRYGFTLVVVEPGVYEFTDEMPDRDADGAVFSRFRRVDEPAPAIVTGDEPPARCFEESYIWRTLERRSPMGGGALGALSWAFFVNGNGRRWVKGNLRDICRSDQPSYLADLLGGNRWSTAQLKRFRPKGWQPINLVPVLPSPPRGISTFSINDMGPLAEAPFGIEPYTLVLGLMMVKTMLAHPDKLPSRNGGPSKRKQIAALERLLALLIEIAVRRGLFRAGQVRRMGAEILAHWTAEVEMEPADDTPAWLKDLNKLTKAVSR